MMAEPETRQLGHKEKSSHLETQVGSREGELRIVPALSDILPPANQHLLNLPKQHHQVGTNVQSPETVGDIPIQTAIGAW